MAKDLFSKIIINAEDRSGAAFAKTRANLESIGTTLGGLQDRLNVILGAQLGNILSNQIGSLIKTADAYKSLDARLKLVSDSTAEYTTAQKELFDIAQRTRSDLGATTDLYGRIETAIKSLGGSQQQALSVTETINKAIALTGPAAESAKAGITQFIQGLDGGVLRGDEFNSMMEQTPGLARALADGLGIPIGKLREMAQAGELTAERLVNALGKSAPKVAEEFSKMPITVGQAFTILSNKFSKFIGENDKATGASAAFAQAITTLGDNLGKVVDIGTDLAALYGVKLAAGIIKNTQATIQAIIAEREQAAAAKDFLETAKLRLNYEVRMAQSRKEFAIEAVKQAQVEQKLAATQEDEVAAAKKLEKAYRELESAQAAYGREQKKLANITEGSGANTNKFAIALKGLQSVASGLTAGKLIADTIGGILNVLGESNEKVRIFAFAWQAAIDKVTAVTLHFLSGAFLDGNDALNRKLEEIDLKYGDLAAASTDSAKSAASAETAKATAIEQAATLQAASFEKVKVASKALTASLDAEAKAQTAVIAQALAERTAAIDALDVSAAQKDQLRLQAQLQAGVQELQLQQTLATEKLNLIDAEYAKELTAAQTNKDRLDQVEFDKRQAKLGVYQGLADYYQSEINKLDSVYGNEINAAAQANQSLQSLEQNHQHALREIERLGFTEKQKQDSLESEYEATLLKLRQEQAKGKEASQQAINDLLNQAKQLHGEVTQAAVSGATTQEEKNSAIYAAQDRLNKLYGIEKGILKDNEQAHKDNAEAAKTAIEGYKAQLGEVNTIISEISKALNEALLLKIGIDQGSLTAAREEIANLTKPETKVITIQTVNSNGDNVATGSGGSTQTSDGVFSGGFATGGAVKPFAGFLPGYGGGDRRHLIAEDGEYVVRKEAVKKIGVAMFENYINKGMIPSGGIRRATGGLVDEYELKRKNDEDKSIIERLLQNIIAYGTSGTSGNFNLTQAQTNIGNVLQSIGRTDLSDKVAEIVNLSASDPKNPNPAANFSKAAFLRDKLLKENFGQGKGFSLPSLPSAVTNIANQGGVLPPAEVIKLDLSFNNKQATGVFDKSSTTQDFLDEIRRAGLASR